MNRSGITNKIFFCAVFSFVSSLNVDPCYAEMPAPEPLKTVSLTAEERAWIEQSHTVRVRVTDQAPYCYHKGGKPFGIAVDYLNTVSKQTGIKFHFVIPSPPFSVDLKGLIQHKGPDLLGSLTPTPEREKNILFTEPYVSSPKFIFTRDDAEFIASMENLTGKTVAVIKSYLVHKELAENYPDINLLFCKNNKEALTAVSSGKAIAFIGSLFATPFMINKYGLKNIKAAAPSALQDAVVAMAVDHQVHAELAEAAESDNLEMRRTRHEGSTRDDAAAARSRREERKIITEAAERESPCRAQPPSTRGRRSPAD